MRITEHPIFRRFWYPVATVAEVAGRPLGRTVLGTELVLWVGADGRVGAAHDRCPHRDARLSTGWVDGGEVVCPYHGWRYATSGAATHIPQLGAGARIPPAACLDTVSVTTRYGLVWVCLDPEPLGGIPDLPEFALDGWRVVQEFDTTWDCPAASLIDNNLDAAHIAYTHRGTFGTPAQPEVPVPDIEPAPFGLIGRLRVPVLNRAGVETPTERITTTEVHAPFLGVFRIGYPDGLMHIMFKACTPIDDDHTRLVQFVVRNDTEADTPAAQIVDFDRRVAVEDRAVLQPIGEPFHLELTQNVHLKIDRFSIEYRRLLAGMVAGDWTPAQPAGV